ncbi:MAG: toprim domain-containing protein, partial [Scardovia wiggsiae]
KNRPTELRVIGKYSGKHTGTRIRYWADPEIFNDTAQFNYDQLIDRVRQTSFLVPGLRIEVVDENVEDTAEGDNRYPGSDSSPSAVIEGMDIAEASVSGHPRVQEFLHEGGVADFVDYLSHGEPVSDIWHIEGDSTYDEETQLVDAEGDLHAEMIRRTCHVDIALRWVNDYETVMRSFVNVVETPGGGMHADGFLNSVTRNIRKTVEANARKLKVNLKDPSMKVERDDVLAGMVAVVTVRIAEPQFQGQTKDVLGTAQVKPIVTRMCDKQFGDMITGSKRGFKDQSSRVLEKIVGEMHARVQARKTKEVTRRKNALESASMPAKLSDCQPGNDDIAELFIVEGDSALGTAKAARNSMFQALLPIRGKILNVQKASVSQILANKECSAIIQVVGAGSGATFDISQARYDKVIMMTDADVDGAHIRTLLLTLFYRYMRPLVESGHVYAAVPPLHRIALAGKRKEEYLYTYSEDELSRVLGRLDSEGTAYNEDIQRYKGLGEMDADQLADTLLFDKVHIERGDKKAPKALDQEALDKLKVLRFDELEEEMET